MFDFKRRWRKKKKQQRVKKRERTGKTLSLSVLCCLAF